MKYWTEEWTKAVQEKTKTDAKYQRQAKGLTFKSMYVQKDCPGGTDRMQIWDLDKGVLVDYEWEEKPAPSDFRTTPFDSKKYFMRISGSYETYVKMNKKEISAMDAIVKRIYKIEGPMIKIVPKLGAIGALADVMSSIECEY